MRKIYMDGQKLIFQIYNNDLINNCGIIYTSIQSIYNSTIDIKDATYTASHNGYIQGIVRSQLTSGNPFVRILVNNTTMYEGMSKSAQYSYIWSNIIQIKKGDIMTYTLTSDTTDGEKILRFYFHR